MEKIEVEYIPLWRKYRNQFITSKLTDTELATLIRTMMDYQFEGIEPGELTGKVLALWSVIRDDLDHARERYESAVQNGRKGGRKKKKPNETEDNRNEGISITESESITESITESISDTKKSQAASEEADISVSKKTYGEFGWVRLSDQEYSELKREMGEEQLRRCITYIDESAQSTGNRNCWLDWRTVLRRCYQKRWHEGTATYGKQPIPQGASGHLGEAEMEAIRRVLAT